MDKTALEGFFPPDLSSASPVSEIFCPARAFAAFLGQHMWTPRSAELWNDVRSNRESYRTPAPNIVCAGNWGWKQRTGKGGGRENNPTFSTFLTIKDGFLTLQHLLRDSTMLIPLQAQYFLLTAKGKAGSHAYGQGREESWLPLPPQSAASLPFFFFNRKRV